MIPRRPIQQHHCSVCAGLCAQRERVCGHGHRARSARSFPPPAPMGLRGVWVVGGALLRQPSGALLRRRLERSFACPSAKGGRAGSCRCAYRKELRCPEPRHAFGIFSCRVQAVTDTVSPCAFSLHTSLSRPELGHSQLPSALSRSRPCRRPNLSRSPPQRIHPFHPK
jgi:hypothetical protein